MTPHTVIFGCGNTLMGDDGFGPAVIAHLEERYSLPRDIRAVDAGTGIREYLFDYLPVPGLRPEKIIIIDGVNMAGRRPGEVFFLDPADIPAGRIHDFSLHQFPTVNLLRELQQQAAINITILAAQVRTLPDRVAPGLSAPMQTAVPRTCDMLAKQITLLPKQ